MNLRHIIDNHSGFSQDERRDKVVIHVMDIKGVAHYQYEGLIRELAVVGNCSIDDWYFLDCAKI